MEIRNLLTFVQVAEINSFTKAARVLGYSQSTVSFQINNWILNWGACCLSVSTIRSLSQIKVVNY